tara:strand:- start:1840 stop:2334 length:495 start_codon:yes stop_codon:yes gene_type:complete
LFKKISKTIKFRKTASDKQIISFIKNIKEKEFISNRNINNAPWKYRRDKKLKFIFLYSRNKIIGSMVIINFKYTRHLSFLYILKEFRGSNLGTYLMKKFFLNTKKIKTIHITKSLNRSEKFYSKFKFFKNINKKNKIILNWIKKCEIFDTDTFKNRYILSERKY